MAKRPGEVLSDMWRGKSVEIREAQGRKLSTFKDREHKNEFIRKLFEDLMAIEDEWYENWAPKERKTIDDRIKESECNDSEGWWKYV